MVGVRKQAILSDQETNADHIRSMTDAELAEFLCCVEWHMAELTECMEWLKRPFEL